MVTGAARETKGGRNDGGTGLQLHSEGFNRALTQQDYDALERIYSEMYMLVWPEPLRVEQQQQVLKAI